MTKCICIIMYIYKYLYIPGDNYAPTQLSLHFDGKMTSNRDDFLIKPQRAKANC